MHKPSQPRLRKKKRAKKISNITKMATVDEIKNEVLSPYMSHRQLSMKEAESLTLSLLELLTVTDIKDPATMKYLARFLTKQSYSELIQERNIVKRCGYPLCQKSQGRIRDPFIDQKVATFLRQNNPYAYLSEYCSKAHFRCSQFFHFQLTEDSLFTRVGVHLDDYQPAIDIQLLEEMIAKESDVKQMIKGISDLNLAAEEDEIEKDISDMLADIKIVENPKPSIIGDFGKDS